MIRKLFIVLILLFSCQSVQAEMAMRITAGQVRSNEKNAVADNEETKETEGVVETTEITETVEATEAVETKGVEEVEEVKETMGEKEVVGPTVATETKVVVEVIKMAEVVGTKEMEDAAAGGVVVEVKEVTAAMETTVATETVETKEITEVVEVKEIVEETGVVATKETVVVVEVKETKETKEIEGTAPIDYKTLGLRSVELKPNDYPDEVIALLEPHKDNENNNNSVLFYSSLGLAYKSKGRLEDAIAAYKRALELASNVPAPAIQYNLGIAYYYNNELSESFSCFLNSSAQRSNHPGTKQWIKHLAGELNIYKVPDTSKLKLVSNQKISVNRKKDDRESRVRIYLTQNGGRIQELSVKDKIYAYGIDSDTERPVDYVIIDGDGDGGFDSVINTKGKFGIPTWAYNPD